MIDAPFIGLLILEALRPHFGENGLQVGSEGLSVIGVAEAEGTDAMTIGSQLFSHAPHPCEDGDDLLGVVRDVVGLGADLHEHIDHGRVDLLKPTVGWVQLIAEDKADYGHTPPSLPPAKRQTTPPFLRQVG